MDGTFLKLLVLKTHDIERLKAFYESLGIDLSEERHGQGPRHFAGQVGPAILEIYPIQENTSSPDTATRLGFTVTNLTQTLATLTGLGVTILKSPHANPWGTRAVVKDPDGRHVELYE